ncbi:uncharacterized protein LOC106883814 [Octopus bimaculoides]|uniref:uncharacterized protein LOC106883814 n=1 Tax=Octopus bimaculoides TaxID=37653 RepID=UPI00071E5B36|nr:uncharacterized protein LOC106883814 [Octopus bimaculoides]|eukprot:XP_014790440.1 PREDICTED: uncharacterized protein LOC106883814 [Octopus bimaculoides]
MHAVEGQQRQFVQLYIVDNVQATTVWAQNATNERYILEVMHRFDEIIRENDVYAASYRISREVELHEEQHPQQEQRPMSVLNLVFNREHTADRRKHNLPTVNEIAMVFSNTDGKPPFNRDFKVYPRNYEVHVISLNILSPNLDPMVYVLFFPYGEPDWQPHVIGNKNRANSRQNVTMLQHKVSLTPVRDGGFNPVIHGGKLFQQKAVDSYLQVEGNNLDFVRTHQHRLKVEQYHGIADHLQNAVNAANAQIGHTVILPSSFQGFPGNMYEHY